MHTDSPPNARPQALARISIPLARFEILEGPDGLFCHSDLLQGDDSDLGFEDDDLYEAAAHALEDVILSHYQSGVDVTEPAYVAGVRSAFDRTLKRYQ